MLIRTLSIATLSVMAFALAAHAEPIDPAQAIAQKFAEESDEPTPAKKPAPVAAPKKIAANPKKVAPKEPGADYEADMLERARAEELDREKEEARQAEIKLAAPMPPPPATPLVAQAPATPATTPSVTHDPTASPATPSAAQAPTPPPTPAALTVMQQPTPAPTPPVPTPPPAARAPIPAPQIAALPPKPVSEPEPQTVSHDAPSPKPTIPATVLLVLDTSAPLGFKPDPIICIDDRCWLSNGIGAPAIAMPRTQAVALPTTNEATTDSCSGKSACVYRGVAIDPATRLEVIEVGEGRGASAGAFTVATDTSCREDHSTLVCDNGLATQNFRIWVVPEATAQVAGTTSLEDAVAEGLPETDTQPSNDK